MPATSSNVTRMSSLRSTRRAVDRPNAPRTPPAPPRSWRRVSQTSAPINSSAGASPSTRLSQNDRPVSGGSALITTSLSASSLVRLAVSMNDGTCVLNRSTFTAFASPGGSYVASRLSSPSMASSRDVTSCTLPASTCSRKNGWYGTCRRFGGAPVRKETRRLSARRPTRTPRNQRLRGIIGGFAGRGCVGDEAGAGAGTYGPLEQKRPASDNLAAKDCPPSRGGEPPRQQLIRAADSLGALTVESRLLFDGPLGGRNRLEPLVRDRVAALDRQAVRAGGETLLRPLDRTQLLGEPLAESLSELVGPRTSISATTQRSSTTTARYRPSRPARPARFRSAPVPAGAAPGLVPYPSSTSNVRAWLARTSRAVSRSRSSTTTSYGPTMESPSDAPAPRFVCRTTDSIPALASSPETSSASCAVAKTSRVTIRMPSIPN